MEMTLQPKSPLFGAQLRIKPALHPNISKSLLGCQEFRRCQATPCMATSSGKQADYSRRRPRKSAIPKTKAPTPKGFAPTSRPQTSTQKKGQSGIEENLVGEIETTELDVQSSGPSHPVKSATKISEKVNTNNEADEISDDEASVFPSESSNVEVGKSLKTQQEEKGYVDESSAQLGRWNQLEVNAGKACESEVDTGTSLVGQLSKVEAEFLDDIAQIDNQLDSIKFTGNRSLVPDSVEEEEEIIVESDTIVKQVGYVDPQAQRKLLEDLAPDSVVEEKEAIVGSDPMVKQVEYVDPQAQRKLLKDLASDSIEEEKEATVESDTMVKQVEYVDPQAQRKLLEDLAPDSVDEEKEAIVESDSMAEQVEYVVDPQAQRKLLEDLAPDSIEEEKEAIVESDTMVKQLEYVDPQAQRTLLEDLASDSVDEKKEKEAIVESDTMLKQVEYVVDPQAQKKLLEELAEENFARESKVFVFPQVVKADTVIEVFLNRSLSALVNENEVFIKGAFNGWRWNSFIEKLRKTDLKGDWWSCHLHVPKEAYRIDFVFFNGGSIYENNNSNDFCFQVEGGFDELGFEDFLLEEKRKELERIAAQEAEREREAEEWRRKEAEMAAREADLAQAKMEVQKKRESLHQVMKFATKLVDNLWHIEPSSFKSQDKVILYYNRSKRPLEHAMEIWIHGGHDNWSDGLTIVEKLRRSERRDGEWWCAEVVIPDRALVLDWVFADGPPGKAKVYDNNNCADFHAIVPNSLPEELFWVEEEQRIYRKLQADRREKEEAARRKAEITARMKSERKKKSIERFLLSQRNIVYTEPIEVQAGKLVTVLYNPSTTVLSGKPEVWFRCSFNRWTHRNGPLPPQKMELADNGTHLTTTVKVPMDAYMMDFVFSERKDGGIYDNKNGMDYHIPVVGGITREPSMHVVHIAVEMAPIAKVGGLGDVVTSLSRAVQELGHKVDIIFPKYDCMNLSNVKDFHFRQSFFCSGTEIKVWFGKVEGLSVYFLEPQNGMFWVGCIYGKNDADRFGFFCQAALEFLLQSGTRPDILHCHDWSTAPVAWLFKEHYKHYGMSNARVIFTIHNLEFGAGHIAKAMAHADNATTVSSTYAREVAGNPVISPHLYKFHGILNGIDPDIWDPFNDNFIPVAYTSENVVEGKKAAKDALQQRLGLKRSTEHPLVGIITRLTVQKGIHLIKHAIWRTIERNGQVVLLGSAPDPRIQNEFVNLANQLHSTHGDRAHLCLTYDEPLSHLIYAGADFILVPSIFEPCGLTQLVAMRYGAIPVVRKTGGLYDTVFDVDNDKERAEAQGLEPNGFSFDMPDAAGVDYALNRAISAWYDSREWFNSLCKRVMEQDWSWNRPALDYLELYHAARK